MSESNSLKDTEIVSLSNVTRNFIRRKKIFSAVDNVNFSLKSGEFVAIVGKSGNGKTTLINLIAGLLKPTYGDVVVCGCNISSSNCSDNEISKLRATSIGYVSQTQTLLPNLTVCANVMLPMYVAFPDCQEDDSYIARVMFLLKKLGIDDLLWCYPKELSGGEMKRVMIARAMMSNPKLLILDEPTSDLDSEHTQIVMDMLMDAANNGSAVLMITHDLKAANCADRIYSMDCGVLSLLDNNAK